MSLYFNHLYTHVKLNYNIDFKLVGLKVPFHHPGRFSKICNTQQWKIISFSSIISSLILISQGTRSNWTKSNLSTQVVYVMVYCIWFIKNKGQGTIILELIDKITWRQCPLIYAVYTPSLSIKRLIVVWQEYWYIIWPTQSQTNLGRGAYI